MIEETPTTATERPESSQIRVMLADDHPLLRQALREVLEKQPDIEVIAEASDGEEAVRLASELAPDVVIMDISMPNVNGLEATRQIKARYPAIAVLVLTIHNDNEHIVNILHAGAAGYLTKSIYGHEIVHAIRAIVCGETVLAQSVSQQILKYAFRYTIKPTSLNVDDQLSARELDVLNLAAKGISNRDIALKLGLSVRTVKAYLAEMFLKLNVASRTEAVIVSLKRGIISLDDLE